MNTFKRAAALVALAAVVLGVFAGSVGAVDSGSPSGNGITPIQVDGNPDCGDLNADNATFPSIMSDFGFKVDGSPNGTFTLTSADGELTGGAPEDPNNSVTISNSDGVTFDWSATLGMDAVIVKGGPNANAYVYSPEAFFDTGLHAPINPENGQPYGISHIEFCYDYEVDVVKTAETTFKRTYAWDITKSVMPETWDLFNGDSGTSEYTVSVDQTGYTDSDWAVAGTITVENNTPFDALVESVSDEISGFGSVAVDCGAATFPYTLASGETLVCSYGTDLPDGSKRVNKSTVATSGQVGGNSATANVVFGEPTSEVNKQINVTDSNGMSWGPVSDDASWTYEKTFTCDADEGANSNTATIDETGQSDDASVMVNCYALDVTKDADTSFDRTWNWTIDKSADQNALTLSLGQQFLVNYSIEVDASPTDDGFAVSGDIYVHNPAPMDATITGVEDALPGATNLTVDCGVDFPYELPAGETLTCSYSADLPDGSSRTNTATATLQNYAYDYAGNMAESGTTSFQGTADVTFGDPTQVFDACIDLSDSMQGDLGTVCASDAPKTFYYSIFVGPYDICGTYTVENTADFLTGDSGTTGEDSWTVTVDVPCVDGCTLTQGYWKTHSEFGPAPYDDTWALLPNGADTMFFLSGQSYYEVLWTAPKGNAYYNLAHQYIAAELNVLNGTSIPSEALDAWNEAAELFSTYTPAEVDELKGKNGNELRAQFIALAEILDAYNNGLIGPGHCSE